MPVQIVIESFCSNADRAMTSFADDIAMHSKGEDYRMRPKTRDSIFMPSTLCFLLAAEHDDAHNRTNHECRTTSLRYRRF